MGFRIAQVADLARQMLFTPSETRGLQIAAAEELLLQLDPAKAYPYDFVLFRITGFHPKLPRNGVVAEDGFTGQLLTGLALQHDLGLLIEQVSQSLNVRVDALAEPVLTIEQVCCRFNVSGKSVQRWRRRGLAARRFIFPDEKVRIGFLAASVERFFAAHQDRLSRAANFTPIEIPERDRILRAARRLAISGCSAEEISRRLARWLDRSPLTIAHVIEQHDAENRSYAILPMAAEPVSDFDRQAIIAACSEGSSIFQAARRFGRPRAMIYRVLVEQRLEYISRQRTKFIDDPLYHQSHAEAVIDDIAAAALGSRQIQPAQTEERQPRDLPAYLQSLYHYPVLTPAEERALFLKLNLHKFQFVALRRKLEAGSVRCRDLQKLERQLDLALQTKNKIVAANLRLVVSSARRHLPSGATNSSARLMDMISDGNIALMRAVDAFDIHRGSRFSTYASLAILKEFAHCAARRDKRRHIAISLQNEPLDSRGLIPSERVAHRDHVQHLLLNLDDNERAVLQTHFGLADHPAADTYEQVARQLGLSKERVRIIEQNALAKLRNSADGD